MQFHSKPVAEHPEVPLADEGRFEQVVTAYTPLSTDTSGQTRCYIVSVGDWRDDHHQRAQLGEILGLVQALGDEIVGHESLRVTRPHPKTYLGSGTCRELARRARDVGATMLVLDAQLTPSQTRNLEDATMMSIADREIVILGVFQRNASSKLAKIQVEIAHLEFLRPRIRGLGLDMDQQAGGVMNGKGAGETASELLARQLDGRLALLRKELAKLDLGQRLRRKRRRGTDAIALVGYTNAGKTSLMNGLTGAGLSARARPFETLDTTIRCLTRHGGDVTIADTVGFIRDLPERLMPSFSSTLASCVDASLLALVLDVSDPEWPMHLSTTRAQLAKLGADQIPVLVVFTKADRVTDLNEHPLRQAVAGEFVVINTADAGAVATLRQRLIDRVRRQHQTKTLFVPYHASSVCKKIYAGCVVSNSVAKEEGLQLTITGPASVLEPIVALLKEVS